MDRQTFQPQELQEWLDARPREGYDESALGVECAWPAAVREALPELS